MIPASENDQPTVSESGQAEDAAARRDTGQLTAALPEANPATADADATLVSAPATAGTGHETSIPGYAIIDELGRGGMSVVYRARQLSLNRLVALKMILAGVHSGPKERQRFRTEAEAIAKLQHPCVVQIYEVAEHDGQPFFALELVDGGSLQGYIDRGPVSVEESAQLIAKLARAMQVAHQHGIVHRDLKPANILLASAGHADEARSGDDAAQPTDGVRPSLAAMIPKVTDFGLAKMLDQGVGQTNTGAVLGTPSYMAPEQAAGRIKEIGPWTDIYALGAILYELLTSRPPFGGDSTLMEILHKVRTEDPVSPVRLRARIPRDLETICLKCLHKDPRKRYKTAEALADDLRRFQRGEPIQARPISAVERSWKWLKRHPTLSAMLSVCVIAVAALLYAGIRHHANLDSAFRELEKSQEQTRLESVRAQSEVTRLKVAKGMYLANNDNLLEAIPWLVDALMLDGDNADAEPMHRRRIGFVLQHCPKPLQVWFHDDRVFSAEYSLDGKHTVTASQDATARMFDALSGATIGPPLRHGGPVQHASYSPDGRHVATASDDGRARIWEAKSGKLVSDALRHDGPVCRVVFSRDGKLIGTGSADGTARVWRMPAGQPVGKPLRHPGPVKRLEFTPDGLLIVAGSMDGTVQCWDVNSSKPLWSSAARHDKGITQVRVDRDGHTVLTSSLDGTARVWETTTGKPLSPPLRHAGQVLWASLSPDGKRVVTASDDNSARIWDAVSGNQVADPMFHKSDVTFAVFSHDGHRVATASDDNMVRLWDARTGRSIGSSIKHNGTVQSLQFSPDDRHLLTSSTDGTARVWLPSPESGAAASFQHRAAVVQAAFNSKGDLLLTASLDGSARLWDLSGKELGKPMTHAGAVNHARFSPDGRLLVTAGSDGLAAVWETSSASKLFDLKHVGPVLDAAFSPDGKLIATCGPDRSARLWNVGNGKLAATMKHDALVTRVVFSPSDPLLATASTDGSARLWRLPDGQPAAMFKHDEAIRSLAFSMNGQRLATASNDRTARVWDIASHKPVAPGLPHASVLTSVGFSPDGTTLATGSDDNTVRLWDVSTGKPLSAPLEHVGSVTSLDFSPDGRLLLTGSISNHATVWDVARGERVLPNLQHGRTVLDVFFHPDGKRFVVACADGSARLWDMPSAAESVNRLRLITPALSGSRFDDSGVVVPLQMNEFRDIWREYQAIQKNGR
ncbi:MAG: hypothetical protein FJ271_06145 [Planctomycetes bacterium]|nr:hypothetical protein [Planctomycetota bacterium]